jgi:uncharacterized protein
MLKIIIAIAMAVYVVVRLVFIFKKRGIKAMLISIAMLVIGGYIGLGVLLYFMQPKLLYYPIHDIDTTAAELGFEYEDVFFTTTDGVKLNGWYVPVKDGNSSDRLTVLFCHGNGGNVSYYVNTMSVLHQMGVHCFVFDYRGYGLSEGKPTEEGTYADTMAAYQWLVNKKGVEADKIVICGWSLGGCIATELAGKVPAGGLWLESAFTSYVDMAVYHYPYLPVRWFCRFRYDTLNYLKKVRCPVLVVHSPEDEIVPFKMGRELYEAAGEPKKFVEISGGHNDSFTESSGQYAGPVAKWIEGLRVREPKATAK